jgi:putative Holliday junction resolvase
VTVEIPRGVRLGLDWGKARIGVAACDPAGMLAYPVTTLAAADPYRQLRRLIEEYEPVALVMGLPVTMAGEIGPAAAAILEHAGRLAREVTPLEVYVVDERLTTAGAAKQLRDAGKDARRQRAMIDQAAAVAIVEQVLDAERAGRQVMARRVEPKEEA